MNHQLTIAVVIGFAAVMSGCGGGTGSAANDAPTPPVAPVSGGSASPAPTFAPARSLAAQCVAPRSGIDPGTGSAYPDRLGDVNIEKSWVRSWSHDTYLWYDEIPNVLATGYASAVDYFSILKTPQLTSSGKPKDKFHFTYSTSDWQALSSAGVSVGYGVDWAVLSSTPPRSIVVAQVAPGSVAEAKGLARGALVLRVDGVDLVNGADVGTLNGGLFPRIAGQSHVFTVQDAGSTTTRQLTLVTAAVTSVPVQQVKTITTADGPVGYLLFNDHIATAERQLIAAIEQLKAANIKDLVIDMRYNGGGYLDIAAQLAFMVAGPESSAGKVFERLAFNDKNPFGYSEAALTTPFVSETLGFSTIAGAALPSLGLKRVYVLTGSGTCSASEAVINGLRGIGIPVHLIGGTTCGKPYGFIPQDNCGVTYFSIQFKGVNQLGFGDYGDGFPATCGAPDDYARALGDPLEARLAAALAHRRSGVCSAPSATDVRYLERKGEVAPGSGLALSPPDQPGRSNRILR